MRIALATEVMPDDEVELAIMDGSPTWYLVEEVRHGARYPHNVVPVWLKLRGQANEVRIVSSLPVHTFVERFADKLVELVAADRLEFPEEYATAQSWQDLHDVCDANEYLIAAMHFFGLDWTADPQETNDFLTEAQDLSARVLFPSHSIKEESI